jgi:hypothetical protein
MAKKVSKKRDNSRLSLASIGFEKAVKAALQTPPPAKGKQSSARATHRKGN